MIRPRKAGKARSGAIGLLAAAAAVALAAQARPDTITMKSGMIYRSLGPPDRDNTLVFMSDGIKRVIVRDSKIERIDPDNSFRGGERFQLVQPMSVHGGVMPREVLAVEAGPWDERGRRMFRYLGSNSRKTISMEQAIIEISPHICKFRGVDGFWVSQVATESVPHKVIVGILDRVDRKNMEERERVVRFLMDVGWDAEARKALDGLLMDFPQKELQERARSARAFLLQREAEGKLLEVEDLFRVHQPARALAILNGLDQKQSGVEVALKARELARNHEQQRGEDRAIAAELRSLSARISEAERAAWKAPLLEVLEAMEHAPDAVRDRLAAWRKARNDPAVPAREQFALAMSGFVVGVQKAVRDLKIAHAYWDARRIVREQLNRATLDESSLKIDELENLAWAGDGPRLETAAILDLLTQIVKLMPPPRHDAETARPGKTILHRTLDSDNAEPTEYAVRLPAEYHPLRSYPAALLLHSGAGPESVIDLWAQEADRRGFILVAPEYAAARRKPAAYEYTASEHAAAELALRDARKRYAIDSDRVCVAGMLEGGNMAWDLGLSHPDLFAGAVVISGFPGKYVPRYLTHHARMPLYLVLGDLAPAVDSFLFSRYIKPLIVKPLDVTYTEYFRRGLEILPEEIPLALDWMARHKRDPYPKSFEYVTARSCDVRFNGVVIEEFSPGRSTAAEVVDPLGQNLKPATLAVKTSGISNLISLQTDGIKRLDVWLSPKLFDFSRKLEVRINKTTYFKQSKVKLELGPMLDDLRLRGDREQIYWYKVKAG